MRSASYSHSLLTFCDKRFVLKTFNHKSAPIWSVSNALSLFTFGVIRLESKSLVPRKGGTSSSRSLSLFKSFRRTRFKHRSRAKALRIRLICCSKCCAKMCPVSCAIINARAASAFLYIPFFSPCIKVLIKPEKINIFFPQTVTALMPRFLTRQISQLHEIPNSFETTLLILSPISLITAILGSFSSFGPKNSKEGTKNCTPSVKKSKSGGKI
mmetsp:Transcript_41807/g.53872  ORF Transcript_41807/g.53872 Transcript_41807/m.53872 type:complete len:213 (-) Transcript_41807:108-746(-)